jgi:hypothetical protein
VLNASRISNITPKNLSLGEEQLRVLLEDFQPYNIQYETL